MSKLDEFGKTLTFRCDPELVAALDALVNAGRFTGTPDRSTVIRMLLWEGVKRSTSNDDGGKSGQ